MSSPPPSDQPEPSAAESDVFDPDVDDEEDTGPLQVSEPSPPVNDWDSPPAQGTWAARFDAPLSVSPRPVQSPRNPKVVLRAVGAVVAVAAVGGVAFWLVRPSSDNPEPPAGAPTTAAAPVSPSPGDEDERRLLRLLPPGYPSDACDPVAAPKDALAQVDCEKNNDPGGPLSATYTLARDTAALDAAFNVAVGAANRVNCPGNIQSPGPWRRNAAPEKIAGTLFCGLREGQPTVIWTDQAERTVNVVQTGPGGPTFPELYTWWASHS